MEDLADHVGVVQEEIRIRRPPLPNVDLIGADEQVRGGKVTQIGNTRGRRDGPFEVAAAVGRRVVDIAIGIPHAELQRFEERILQAIEHIGFGGKLHAVGPLPLIEQLLQMIIGGIVIVDAGGRDRGGIVVVVGNREGRSHQARVEDHASRPEGAEIIAHFTGNLDRPIVPFAAKGALIGVGRIVERLRACQAVGVVSRQAVDETGRGAGTVVFLRDIVAVVARWIERNIVDEEAGVCPTGNADEKVDAMFIVIPGIKVVPVELGILVGLPLQHGRDAGPLAIDRIHLNAEIVGVVTADAGGIGGEVELLAEGTEVHVVVHDLVHGLGARKRNIQQRSEFTRSYLPAIAHQAADGVAILLRLGRINAAGSGSDG